MEITKSSGNIFEDLGLSPGTAAAAQLRSSLMIAIRRLIEDRSLTQQQAASLFGVSQPRISNLMRGKIGLFSVDGLIEMLATAGVHVTLTVEDDAYIIVQSKPYVTFHDRRTRINFASELVASWASKFAKQWSDTRHAGLSESVISSQGSLILDYRGEIHGKEGIDA